MHRLKSIRSTNRSSNAGREGSALGSFPPTISSIAAGAAVIRTGENDVCSQPQQFLHARSRAASTGHLHTLPLPQCLSSSSSSASPCDFSTGTDSLSQSLAAPKVPKIRSKTSSTSRPDRRAGTLSADADSSHLLPTKKKINPSLSSFSSDSPAAEETFHSKLSTTTASSSDLLQQGSSSSPSPIPTAAGESHVPVKVSRERRIGVATSPVGCQTKDGAAVLPQMANDRHRFGTPTFENRFGTGTVVKNLLKSRSGEALIYSPQHLIQNHQVGEMLFTDEIVSKVVRKKKSLPIAAITTEGGGETDTPKASPGTGPSTPPKVRRMEAMCGGSGCLVLPPSMEEPTSSSPFFLSGASTVPKDSSNIPRRAEPGSLEERKVELTLEKYEEAPVEDLTFQFRPLVRVVGNSTRSMASQVLVCRCPTTLVEPSATNQYQVPTYRNVKERLDELERQDRSWMIWELSSKNEPLRALFGPQIRNQVRNSIFSPVL